ncbi:MAG: hypothetical protein A2283_23085 [Lentisphaerae bacterium RIFOXYA12_FULL_48_11]|nr:MAG: hypothetical protein A2283_23085 [Lentisphaerae bacterium RIFOXYA12_FULL_48_11]
MRKIVHFCSLAVIAASLIFAGVFLSGCESADGVDGLTLDPSSVSLTPGGGSNSVVFTAALNTTNELAYPLEWSVSDGSLGSISASTANSAVYRSTGKNGSNVVKAKDQYGNEGVATVNQGSDSYELSLSASPGSLSSGTNSCTVTVTGGYAPYRWSVSDSSLGEISGSGSSVMYTSFGPGSNAIICRDEYGMSVSISITQYSSSSESSSGGATPTPGG